MSRKRVNVLISIYEEDHELAKKLFPRPIGYNAVFRELIHRYMNSKRKEQSELSSMASEDTNEHPE